MHCIEMDSNEISNILDKTLHFCGKLLLKGSD